MAEERHLYLVVHPNHSLVASQLDPERFIKHYVRESARYFEGKLVFVELDPGFRHPWFDVDSAYAQLKPHDDGSPKATKFISSYRVLEHVDFGAMGTLYVCDASGGYVALAPAPGSPEEAPAGRDRDACGPSCDEELRVILEMDAPPSAGATGLAREAAALARVEGLEAHARAAETRLLNSAGRLS